MNITNVRPALLPDSRLYAVAWKSDGLQELQPGEYTELWTLVLPLPGLIVGSTYTRLTVERALVKQS